MALNQWHDLGFNSHPVDEDRLERCIAAFDMFLIDEAGEDLGGVRLQCSRSNRNSDF